MNRSDFVNKLAQSYPKHDREELNNIVDNIFAAMTNSLVKSDRIEIRGFGSFSLKTRKTTNSIYFRASKNLKNKINQI